MRVTLAIGFGFVVSGCSSAPFDAPYSAYVEFKTSALEITEGTYCGSGGSFTDEPDYTGAAHTFDIQVIDDNTGLPLERVSMNVEVFAYAGLYVLPQEAVKVVDYPALPDEVSSQADIRDACTDEDGNFDSTEEWCSWYWDVEDEQYFQLGTDYADAGGFAPTYLLGETDSRGIFGIYAFIDCIYGDAEIRASIGHANDSLEITASSSG